MNVWGSTTSGLFLAPVVAVGGRTGAAEGGRTGAVSYTAEIRAERSDRREPVSGWHGKQKKGAKAERRAIKRVEAEARNALTKPERRRAYRREQAA